MACVSSTTRPAAEGPFWTVRSNGRVIIADRAPNADCVPATYAEFVSQEWAIALHELPAAVLDGLSDADHGRLVAEGRLPMPEGKR